MDDIDVENNSINFCKVCSGAIEEKFIEKRVRKVCKKCGKIQYENPIPAVAVVSKNSRGEILLIKRKVDPKKGYWALPSGFIEINELPEKAATREFKEETGYIGKIKKLIGVYSQESKNYKQVLVIVYELKIVGGRNNASDDAEEVSFFKKKEMPPLAFLSHYHALKLKK